MLVDVNRRIGWILGNKAGRALVQDKPLDGQFIVHHGNNNIIMLCLSGSVNHQNIIMLNPGPGHGLTIHPDEKGCGLILDEQLVQIKAAICVVFCR